MQNFNNPIQEELIETELTKRNRIEQGREEANVNLKYQKLSLCQPQKKKKILYKRELHPSAKHD